MIRATVASFAAAALALTAAATTPALATGRGAAHALPSRAYRANDYAHGQAMSILPPGENGLATAAQLAAFETSGDRPPNSHDQFDQYANLLYGYQGLTDDQLSNFYNDESFGVRTADIIRTEMPSDSTYSSGDAVIERDKLDIPHIYGATNSAAAFGAGYAQAEDRLFLMDILRHYGSGTLSSFIGPSCSDEEMDHDQLLLAPYTQQQATQQINRLPKEYGHAGLVAKQMIDAYVEGVNAWIAHVNSPAGAGDMDGDYPAAINDVPQPWTPGDVVQIAGLIGGIFGKGGGIEVANAAFYKYLRQQLGAKQGAKAFAEFKEQNDPGAQTTVVDKTFPYESVRHVNPKLTALPDKPRKPLTGGPVDTTSNCDVTKANPTVLATIASLSTMPQHMSNALVVDAKESKAHHPIAVFGPQVSYFSPQILSQEEISAPSYHAEGASFPGTGLVELGRGEDFAWSATSAGSDLIDQRLERLCAPKGKKPKPTEQRYEFKGKCVKMQEEHFVEDAVTKPGGMGGPAHLDHKILLTKHGVVQGFTTADHGQPVAVVNQRSTFNHDVDSVIGFLNWGDPRKTHSVKTWMEGASQILYTFNWFYVDNKHDGYFVSGLDPNRAKGADPNLPTWGTGSAEWRGFLSTRKHVHEVDPKQGFFVSWNNKPAPGFSAADDQYGYGPTYRSQMLVDALKHQIAVTHHKLTRANVVTAMETAASQDLDGLTVLPQLLKYEKGRHHPAGVTAMLQVLAHWHATGAHRLKRQTTDTQYQQHAAVAVMDELEPNLIQAVYNRLLAKGGLGGQTTTGGATTAGYSILPMQYVNTPNSGDSHLGSAYDGGWEGYMQKTLQQLRGKHPLDPFTAVITSKWCKSGPASCHTAITKALAKTYRHLAKVNGTKQVKKWTIDSAVKSDPGGATTMPQYDAIVFRPLGVIDQPHPDWQNRPTFQQVVEFPAHR
jgi:acyl-homoserine lactone acylase PvdQ